MSSLEPAPLPKQLRSQLENTVKSAREVTEKAAFAVLAQLGAGDAKPPAYLNDNEKALRRRLRAHGRALGDLKQSNEEQDLTRLVWEVAYEHWHRMLFARFLAENGLLLWEPGAAMSLDDCSDMVANHREMALGAKSHWELAGKLAARMLPQVFKPRSPVFELSFAPEHQRELERLLAALPVEVFKASDSLGWVYQFWQAKRKDEVNASEVKIGADELPAVTQLFTEPYMVDFLLHNSLGAWWVTRHPEKPCPVPLTYLRILEDGTPAAGRFDCWPDTLTKFKLLDPCCGSGHFLVAAFLMLVPMRMAAEGLSVMDAVDYVLQDNLHGLELDARCVEIAVFALALAAWRFRDENGEPLGVRVDMPAPNIACCGLKVAARPEDWMALVPDDAPHADYLRQELRLLHASFAQAPLLGSLLDPARSLKNDLATSSFETVHRLLVQALAVEPISRLVGPHEIDEDAWDLSISAQGLLESARILTGRYNLVITNVPYLVRGKQSDTLKSFCESRYPEAKNELANVFLQRCLELSFPDGAGVIQVVMPQNWLFLTSYGRQRKSLLRDVTWNLIARLGMAAFEIMDWWAFNIILITQTNKVPADNFVLRVIDADVVKATEQKAKLLRHGDIAEAVQGSQLRNPGSIISLAALSATTMLSRYTGCFQGTSTGDNLRFLRTFWEAASLTGLNLFQGPSEVPQEYSGREHVIDWDDLTQFNGAAIRGEAAWGRKGVAIGQMRNLPATLYTGSRFSNSTPVIIPKSEEHLAAIWCFCNSQEFLASLREINQKLSVDNGYVGKIAFDLARWQEIASEEFPNGLPKPYSNDPTQWLFHGHPNVATKELQVAVARLTGYRWPAETDGGMELAEDARTWIARCEKLSARTDDDGIVCLSSVRGEQPADVRLLALLIDAWETVEPGSWKPAILDRLLADVDCAGKSLDVWLRDSFFEQHAKIFHNRPFIWHIWDGLKDGFGALVNYHKLDTKNLERLIHTYLGDWIRQQEEGIRKSLDGAVLRLSAAQNLKVRLEWVLAGEAPYDIFVRWKPLDQQPIGWNPDLNDGVRLNIRPFMTAEVLRHNKKPKLNITWDKDRGKDVESAPWFKVFAAERINDHHLTLAEKRAARGLS